MLPSHVWLYDPEDCSTTGLPVPCHLLEFSQVHVYRLGDSIQLSHPLMPSYHSGLNLSQIRDFSNIFTVHIGWPKYWSFSFSISSSSEYSGLISLKIDWFDLFALQGTFKSLPRHHSSMASVLWHSTSFTIQLSQPYVTTGKTISLTIWNFVYISKVMSLLFSTLFRFVIAFLPGNDHLMISWQLSPSAVILESKKRTTVTTSTLSPSIYHEVKGPDVMFFFFFFNI